MYVFSIPLGFSFQSLPASSFTKAHAQKFGKRIGQVLCTVSGNLFGLPLLAAAFALAAGQPAARLRAGSRPVQVLGYFLIVAGIVLIGWAHLAICGYAAAPSVADVLVQRGPYRQATPSSGDCALFRWVF